MSDNKYYVKSAGSGALRHPTQMSRVYCPLKSSPWAYVNTCTQPATKHFPTLLLYSSPSEAHSMKLAVSLLLLACLTPTFAAAQDDADATARAKVLALEKAWNQAYKVGDTKALGAILD